MRLIWLSSESAFHASSSCERPCARRSSRRCLPKAFNPEGWIAYFTPLKDRIEVFQDHEARVYVNNAQLQQAKDRLRDPQSINFFDFDFAEGINIRLQATSADRNESELLNGVAYELLRLNQAYNIVPSLIAKVGYPYWSRSEIFYSGGSGQQPVVLLPFAPLTSDSVEAVLLATPLTGSEGWYTTLYTRKQIDSLITTTASGANGLGFKVASFVFFDHKLFGKKSDALADWVIAVLDGSNLTLATDRCGAITWCVELQALAFNETPVPDRTLHCWLVVVDCSGSASSGGSSSSLCVLDENFQWVCDYMNGNWEANGGGSGGGSSPTNPGNTSNTDMGTDILNLYNNGQISEEVMNQLLTLHFAIGLSGNELDLLLEKPLLLAAVFEFYSAHPDHHAPDVIRSLLELELSGVFPAVEIPIFGWPDLYANFVVNCAIVKAENPTWNQYQIYLAATWRTVSGIVHTALDICGLIPIGGEPCDLINGVIYTLEGNAVDAALSFAATLPIAGWAATGAKWAGLTVLFKGTVHHIDVKLVNGIVDFGDRNKLRTILGITNPNHEAHHIIPWVSVSHPFTQLAGKGNFHMNHPFNGLELEKYRLLTQAGTHGPHPQYNEKVLAKMDELWGNLQAHYGVNTVPAAEARIKLIELQSNIAAHINLNPTTKINDLTLNGVQLPSVP